MTHRFISSGTPLSHFSANGAAKGYELLIRVVNVDDDGKVTFPTRELWAKIDAESDKLEFLLNSSNSVDDDQEDQLDTIAEANEAMRGGLSWLRSLKRQSPYAIAFAGTGAWYVTALVKAKPRIWKEVNGEYKLHEKNLRTWLATSEEGAEELDDEEDWACLSCNGEDNEEEDEDDAADRWGYYGDGQDELYDEEGPFGEDEELSGFDEDNQALEGGDNEEQAEEPVGEGGTSAGADDDDLPKQANQTQTLG